MPLDYVLGPRQWAPKSASMGAEMLIGEESRRCVVFIGDDNPKFEATGTGFFVYVDKPHWGMYLVTAAHIAKDLVGPFKIRGNNKAGVAQDATITKARWHNHKDRTVDVSVLPLEIPRELDVQPCRLHDVLDEGRREAKGIGHGSVTYTIGLFSGLGERQKVTPIVLGGHIALMPDGETLPIRNWRTDTGTMRMEGYLVQASTVPGVSGSPVFVRRPVLAFPGTLDPNAPGFSGIIPQAYGAVFLLGLSRGTWIVDPGWLQKELLLREFHEATGRPMDKIVLAMGMSTVTPGEKILDIINSRELKKLRADAAAERDEKHAAVSTSARRGRAAGSEPPATEPDPQHRERFSRVLAAAAKPRKATPRT